MREPRGSALRCSFSGTEGRFWHLPLLSTQGPIPCNSPPALRGGGRSHAVTGFLSSLAGSRGKAGGTGPKVVGATLQLLWPGMEAVLEEPGSPHLHGAVAQLDGLVDALHDLVEVCGKGEKQGSRHRLPLPLTPHPQWSARTIRGLREHRIRGPRSRSFRLCRPRGKSEGIV